MPKSEKDEVINNLTARIFTAMLEELVLDATLQSHQEVAKARATCPVCHTKCNTVHPPISLANAIDSGAMSAVARADTPSSMTSEPRLPSTNGALGNGTSASGSGENVAGTGTGASTPPSIKDGNLYFECVVCKRACASNRYAPHLANCMGLPSTRRAPVRTNSSTKYNSSSRAPSDNVRSDSPASDAGNMSDDKGKNKSKSKSKKGDEGDYSLKRKRPESPQISPSKKAKKGKIPVSPVSRVKQNQDTAGLPGNPHYSPSNSHSKVPSKLRESSTTSFLDRSPSSRGSSPAAAATPASSSFSTTSPAKGKSGGSSGAGNNQRNRPVVGTGPPKRPSPAQAAARPAPVHIHHYMGLDEGDETGSSTETDESS